AHFRRADFRAVAAAPAAVAHAGEIDRRHAVMAHEVGRDERPPVGMRAAAVHEQKPAAAQRFLLGPQQIMDRAAVDGDEALLARLGDRPAEPLGRGRADLQILGGNAQTKLLLGALRAPAYAGAGSSALAPYNITSIAAGV